MSAETDGNQHIAAVALTALNFDYSDVDGKPETQFMCLKRLVGERGFEPPTPWSRTRFRHLLKFVESCCLQLIAVEPFAGCSLNAVESFGILAFPQPQNRLHFCLLS